MGDIAKVDLFIYVLCCLRIWYKKYWWPIFVYLFDACNANAWLLLKNLHPNDLTFACLYIFFVEILLILTLKRKVTHLQEVYTEKKLMTYTRDDGRNNLSEYSKFRKPCKYYGNGTDFICNKFWKGFHP